LGCLLADAADDEAALTYLEKAHDGGLIAPGSPAAQLHCRVYLRFALHHVAARDFARAQQVVLRALKRQDDPELRKLASLVESACGTVSAAPSVDEQAVVQLGKLYRASSRPGHLLVRSCLVAHHHLAYERARNRAGVATADLWEDVSRIWDKHIRGQRQFWQEYIATYKRGPLTAGAEELERRIVNQVGGVCLNLCKRCLEEQQIPDAEGHWQIAVQLLGPRAARDLFREVVGSVDRLLSQTASRISPWYARELYQFLSVRL
jgi:hypothetical protein